MLIWPYVLIISSHLVLVDHWKVRHYSKSGDDFLLDWNILFHIHLVVACRLTLFVVNYRLTLEDRWEISIENLFHWLSFHRSIIRCWEKIENKLNRNLWDEKNKSLRNDFDNREDFLIISKQHQPNFLIHMFWSFQWDWFHHYITID